MIHLLLAIIYISFISLGLPDSLLGSAWPGIYQEFGVPVSYAGILSMIIAGCTIISSLCSDRLVRKTGTGCITAVSVGMTAAALMGFSGSHSFRSLCLWAIPYGLGAGSVDAVLNNYVALHYRARHMNWLHCFWGIGASTGPYIMGLCLSRNMGWNSGYRIVAVIQIVLSALLFISIPLWEKQTAPESLKNIQPVRLHLSQLLSLRGTKPVLLIFFCYCSLETATGLWGSSYMVMQKGITKELAAKLCALFYAGITAGRFLSGFLTMRFSSRSMIRSGQVCVITGIMIIFFSHTPEAAGIGFVLAGLGCAPIYPELLQQTPERFGKKVSQSIMGTQMAAAYTGSTFSPFITGFIVEKINMSLYPLILLFFVTVMVVLVEHENKNLPLSGKKQG